MTRMTWSDPGTRFFETGVDRGVLYVNNVAVVWNGLVSISESPTGGEAKAYYQDGVKYLNVATSEEFAATLDAFSSPKEFAPCDGTGSIAKGLFATQQPRRAFSLSYRTLVGNDLEAQNHGYKIHLVYNALAAPASRTYSTTSDTTEPSTLSWSLTTLPPSLTGLKPTAHFVIDSRETPRMLLAAIEDMLYGTDGTDPRMPLVSELIELFETEGPLARTNLITNPSMETNITGWSSGGGRLTLSQFSDVTAFSGTKSLRAVANVAMTAANGYITATALGVVPGNTYTLTAYVRPLTTSRSMRAAVQWKDSASVVIGSAAYGTVVLAPAGEWTRVAFTGLAAVGADRVTVLFYCQDALAIGDTIDFDAILLEVSETVQSYFDGSTDVSNHNYPHWSGVAHASTSYTNSWN